MTINDWKKTACILCSLNCGLEVKTGGQFEREILQVRGDKNHPVSQGYLCEKPQRLNYYQTSADRLNSPLRRKSDGTFEKVSWLTAITEIAQRFQSIKDAYGGEKIFYYGGGGQGNHLGGSYGVATLKALGNKYRSNALAQEKTGEFWVNGKMLGTGVHGDFEHCEVAVFIGKNPWHSHGIARARKVLKEMSKEPKRTMIVIDPRVSETAKIADIHLQLKPGTDAWCLAALVAIIVQENLLKSEWVQAHTTGYKTIKPYFEAIDIEQYAGYCGLKLEQLREVAQIIARAESVSVLEDLGLQMSIHSTLGSYLQRFIWLLTGNFGRKGTNNSPLPFLGLNEMAKGTVGKKKTGYRPAKLSPVAKAKIIIGLIPCNVIPEEILTDHPDRYRAMLIESGNPVHSLADSKKMREALRALDFVVVIDVAMTETAREADYILPAASQFEKCESTYFNLEYPENAFHLRHRIFKPLRGTLPEPEIHSRLVEALGAIGERDYRPLRQALKLGKNAFAAAFFAAMALNKRIARYPQIALYRVLGPTLPEGLEASAIYWGVAHQFVKSNPQAAAKAGFKGHMFKAGALFFKTLLNSQSGMIYSKEAYDASWSRIGLPEGKINLVIPELLAELEELESGPVKNKDYPFILSAGERRSGTTNTIIRNPEWSKKALSFLRMSPEDAKELGCKDGELVTLSTRADTVDVLLEITDTMQSGHISLPNGTGLDYQNKEGFIQRDGVAPNELTRSEDRDFLAGTPWHKHVLARVEKV